MTLDKIQKRLFCTVREGAFAPNAGIWQIVSKLLSCLPLGRLAFRISIAAKRISSLGGSYIDERAIEYPWILEQLKLLEKDSIVLDVGCAEITLSHELLARKFRVVGIDIREYPFKNKRMHFVKRSVLNTGLKDNIFDSIIMVSTIEHIALGRKDYGQLIFDDEGDMKAMKELHRILKPRGIIMITTPYIGNKPYQVSRFSRYYNRERLKELIKDFCIIKVDYFHRNQKQKSFSDVPGLACLVLQKPEE